MTKSNWKNLINEQMAALGVQNSAYNSAIETLAGILEQRIKPLKSLKIPAVNP